MTIAATRTLELNINSIIQLAMNLAGLMNPQQSTSDPQFSPYRGMALNFLEIICKSTQNVAVIERHTVLQSATVTALSATVTLSTSAMAMLGQAMFSETAGTEQVPVTLIDLAAYQAIPDKTLTGTPSVAYFNRQPIPSLTLWPVPDTNGDIVVQSHILAADVSNASETLDFERHWTEYFLWRLAFYLSTSGTLPVNERAMLRSEADRLLGNAVEYSRSNVPAQIRFAHRTPWT
jgi:hypothetical protein